MTLCVPRTRRRSGRGRGTGAKGGGETGRSQSDPKLPAEAAAKAATAAPLALAVSFLEPAPKVLGPFAAVRDCKLAKSQIRLRLTRWAAGACVRVRVRALGCVSARRLSQERREAWSFNGGCVRATQSFSVSVCLSVPLFVCLSVSR